MKNNNILRIIYKENYPVIRRFILGNSGNRRDAEDIFQEAFVIIYRRLSNEGFYLDCSFNTYIFSICKILWYKELRNRNWVYSGNLEEEIATNTDDVPLFMKDDFEKSKLIQKHLTHMNSECRQLLMLFYSNVPLKEITYILGFGSEKYTRKRKFTCKKKLIELIKNDPMYKEIMNSD